MKTDGRDGGETQSRLQRLGSAAQKLTQFSSGLSRPFIQRPVMTMLLTVSVLVFGILSYNQLAVNDLPAVDYPVISVSASYPKTSWKTLISRWTVSASFKLFC